MKSDEPTLTPGTLMDGRYQIERLIGAGGMGEVYEATHVAIGRRVAIKCLRSTHKGSDEAVQRFQREAQLAGSIGHDNICEVTDVGTAPHGAPYLVMPLLKGASLADLFAGSKPMAVARLVDILSQTLSALQAAHDERIIHRDLKPENIFVTKLGDREDFAKLLDFGISKIVDQDSVSNFTRTGTVVGTPNYMSPEQARGAKSIDHRVDIYAVGVILYEGLTGTVPFRGDSYNEVMFKIVSEPFTAPSKINPSISSGLERLVLKAMSRHPSDRFNSADEMRAALEQTLADSPPAETSSLTSSTTAVGESGPFTPTGAGAVATPPSRAVWATDNRLPAAGIARLPEYWAQLRAAVASNKRLFVAALAVLGIACIGLALALLGERRAETASPLPVAKPASDRALGPTSKPGSGPSALGLTPGAEPASGSSASKPEPAQHGIAAGLEPPRPEPAATSIGPTPDSENAKPSVERPVSSPAKRKTIASRSRSRKSASMPSRRQASARRSSKAAPMPPQPEPPAKRREPTSPRTIKGRFGTEFILDE